MLDFLTALPAYAVIPIAVVLVGLVAFLVVKSFREGREISFWPPRIGPRPEGAGKKERDEARPAPTPAADARAPAPRPPPPKPGMPRFREPRRESLQPLEIIRETDHSVIRKCAVDDGAFVLKGTKAKYCDLTALEQLAGHAWEPGALAGFPPARAPRFVLGPMAAAIPYMVWEQDGLVWELQEYVDGVSLGDVVLRNRRGIGPPLLLDVVQGLIWLLAELRDLRILHRDITPFNLLLTGAGELRVIDWSYAVRDGAAQVPVGTPRYAPPEQERGQATVRSDWYSFGATVFSLANGYAPFERGEAHFRGGLERIDTRNFRPRAYGTWEAAVEKLLARDPAERPDPSELGLAPDSGEIVQHVTDILELDALGYLVFTRSDWWVSSPTHPDVADWRGRLDEAARGETPLAAAAKRVLDWLERAAR